MSRPGIRGWLVVALFATLPSTGCFLSRLFGKSADGPQEVSFNVASPPAVNEGRPFYLIVRTVDVKAWVTETYDDVAAKVMTPDATVLQTVVLFPGSEVQSVHVTVPQKISVAASFLFTTPSGSWQARFDSPLPEKVDIALQNGAIRTIRPPAAAQ